MSTPSWPEYLDAVEAAALDVREALLAGRTPVMPVLVHPEGRPEPHEEDRRGAVAALVEQVTTFLAAQQDEVRDRLQALPHQRPTFAGHTADSLGGRFDLRG